MAADFNMILDASQLATFCAKMDALTTAVNRITLTVNTPPIDLTALTQAVKDLGYNNLTFSFPSHVIKTNGREGVVLP